MLRPYDDASGTFHEEYNEAIDCKVRLVGYNTGNATFYCETVPAGRVWVELLNLNGVIRP
jgi:hypothetical protein